MCLLYPCEGKGRSRAKGAAREGEQLTRDRSLRSRFRCGRASCRYRRHSTRFRRTSWEHFDARSSWAIYSLSGNLLNARQNLADRAHFRRHLVGERRPHCRVEIFEGRDVNSSAAFMPGAAAKLHRQLLELGFRLAGNASQNYRRQDEDTRRSTLRAGPPSLQARPFLRVSSVRSRAQIALAGSFGSNVISMSDHYN